MPKKGKLDGNSMWQCRKSRRIVSIVVLSSCYLAHANERILDPSLRRLQDEHRRLHPASVFSYSLRRSNSSRHEGVDSDVRIVSDLMRCYIYSSHLLRLFVSLVSKVGGTAVPDASMFPSYAFTAGRELCGATFIHPDILLSAARECKLNTTGF